jgi:hypothetical protein
MPGAVVFNKPESRRRERRDVALAAQRMLDDVTREILAQVAGADPVRRLPDDVEAGLERRGGRGQVGRAEAVLRSRSVTAAHTATLGDPAVARTHIC